MIEPQLTLHKQYLDTFGTPAGRVVLADICRRGGLMQSTFNADPMRAAYGEGMRDLALYIHNMLDTRQADRLLAEQEKR